MARCYLVYWLPQQDAFGDARQEIVPVEMLKVQDLGPRCVGLTIRK